MDIYDVARFSCSREIVHTSLSTYNQEIFNEAFIIYHHTRNINLMPQYERENELMNDRTRIQYAGARFRDWAEASDSYFYLLDNGP